MSKKVTTKEQKKQDLVIIDSQLHQLAVDDNELRSIAAVNFGSVAWHLKLLGIPEIWRETQGEGIVIATLDTGVDTSHPALQGAVLEEKDFTGEGKGDRNGHGTHIAGILVGRRIEAGFCSIAPKAKLLAGKVMDKYGRGASVDIARGIDWAVKKGAHIITLSVNGPECDPALFKAIYNALAKGIMVFCGAGNLGAYKRDNLGYPGNFPPVCTVGSCDRYGNVSAYSSRGGEIDITAPGEKIFSTFLNGSYAQMSGTSMATPVAAGTAALMLAKHRKNKENLTPIRNMEEMMQHIKRLTTHRDNRDNREGYGCLMPFLAMYEDVEIDMVKDSSITMVKDSSITQLLELIITMVKDSSITMVKDSSITEVLETTLKMVKDSSITMVKDSSITQLLDTVIQMVKDSSITMVKDSSITVLLEAMITMVKDSSITRVEHILNSVRVPLRLLGKLLVIIRATTGSKKRTAKK